MRRVRLRTVFIFLLGVLAGSLLLRTSQDVQDAEQQVLDLQSKINAEQEQIRVLKAEWQYLNSPIRLEALAGEYLPELRPPEPDQMMEEPGEFPDVVDPFLVRDEDLKEDGPILVKPQLVSFGGDEPEGHEERTVVVPRSKPQPHKDFDALLNDLSDGGAP